MVELPEWINRKTVERAYSRAQDACDKGWSRFADRGIRLAQMRDPKLLKALEGCTEVLDAVAEEQYGRTRRDAGTPFAYRVDPTELQMWRNAYTLADAGTPGAQYGYIYGATAELAGLL